MYGLPANFDPSFFAGRPLELVAFGKFTVTLHFGDKVFLQIESSFKHGEDWNEFPLKDSRLMQLLEKKVEAASCEGYGTLSLRFERGEVIQCFDSAPNYESYHIGLPDGTLLIV